MKDDRIKRVTTSRVLGWAAEGCFHALGAMVIVVLLSVAFAQRGTIPLLMESYTPEMLSLTWDKLLVQLGMGVGVYSILLMAYRSWRVRSASKVTRVLRRSRGSVMVETLIVIVPFLALTSGIAQLSILNIGAVLADVAVYQGARTAQIWQAESDMNRTGKSGTDGGWAWTVREKSMSASALIMAPTAPYAFSVGRFQNDGSSADFRRLRATMWGGFGRFGVPSENQRWETSIKSEGGNTGNSYSNGCFNLDVSTDTISDSAFNLAFDGGGSAWDRACRKMTAAYMCFESGKYEVVTTGGRVGVDFEYQFPILFPWFGRLFGENSADGCYGGNGTMLGGYHHTMKRNFTLPRYTQVN